MRNAVAPVAGLVLVTLTAWAVLHGPHLAMSESSPVADAGISQELAQDRSARVENVRYRLSLDIPAARSAAIVGTIEARFDLRDASHALAFDFAQTADHLLKVSVGGVAVNPVSAEGISNCLVPPFPQGRKSWRSRSSPATSR